MVLSYEEVVNLMSSFLICICGGDVPSDRAASQIYSSTKDNANIFVGDCLGSGKKVLDVAKVIGDVDKDKFWVDVDEHIYDYLHQAKH